VLEHPISIPPPRDAETFLAKKALVKEKSAIDFGLWGALIPTSIDHLAEMHELGAVAFKGFMSAAGADYPMVEDGQLLAGLQVAGRIGAIIGVHAESEALTTYFTDRLAQAGRRDPRAIAEARPPIAEYESIQRAIVLARYANARLHIVHMSIPEGADLIQSARREGVQVTSETCPHYLHLDWTALDRLGGYAKCKPPLRSPESTEQLWQAVLDGKIDFIAADHAPYTRAEKERGTIWDAPWGMPGIQTMIPILISDGIIKRGWDLVSFVRFTSSNCARRFGIYGRKGTIRIGSDGDLVVIDPQSSWTVRSEDLFYKQGWSALGGETLNGRIEQTVVRGKVVYDGGRITVASGYGQFVCLTARLRSATRWNARRWRSEDRSRRWNSQTGTGPMTARLAAMCARSGSLPPAGGAPSRTAWSCWRARKSPPSEPPRSSRTNWRLARSSTLLEARSCPVWWMRTLISRSRQTAVHTSRWCWIRTR
jgi:allantoinase